VTYGYALRLFFDFSGYTAIAIGLGIWTGVTLPENFNRPYLQRNIALFWQNWHMSLTTWFRSYLFLPFSRWLLQHQIPIPAYAIAQAVTMLCIAGWHGLTPHFMAWGAWHAGGLICHHWLTRATRRWFLHRPQWYQRSMAWVGGIFTFHFVTLGWVFFVLPDPLPFFQKLFPL
jgi:alginate O-acetyltransferase complex protein AlgI